MSTILIKNGFIVTEHEIIKGDLLIEDEKIKQIADYIDSSADKVINANSNLIFPGSIDAHTHMELPIKNGTSSDSFESGTLAALFGGTTTIIDFANQVKGNTLDHALKTWHKKAKDNSYCDYKFHLSVTDVNDQTLTEIKNMYECQGVYSFKTFLAYPNMMITPEDLEKIMKTVKSVGGVVTLHAELNQVIEDRENELGKKNQTSAHYHGTSRPDSAEAKAIEIALKLAQQTNCPLYIVHLSSKKGFDLLKKAKAKTPHLFIETCPQYLLLDDSKYIIEDPKEVAKFVLSPPLRTPQDQVSLWEGVISKTIDVIATDHCPFTTLQKTQNLSHFKHIPNGIPGVENRFELMYYECVEKRKMTLTDFSNIMTTNPSRIFKLYPRKGVIAVGSDADLIIFDKKKKWSISGSNHHMRVDYNPYENFTLTGKVHSVFLRGNLMIQNEKLFNWEKIGQFIF